MKIPSDFTLGAIPYRVRLVNHIDKGETLGITDSDEGEIKLMRDISRARLGQTFCHELFHCLFEAAGRGDLAEDETLVDVMGTLLHQYLETNKGIAK